MTSLVLDSYKHRIQIQCWTHKWPTPTPTPYLLHIGKLWTVLIMYSKDNNHVINKFNCILYSIFGWLNSTSRGTSVVQWWCQFKHGWGANEIIKDLLANHSNELCTIYLQDASLLTFHDSVCQTLKMAYWDSLSRNLISCCQYHGCWCPGDTRSWASAAMILTWFA